MKLKNIKLSIILGNLFVALFLFSGCSSCMRADWQEVYNQYISDPNGYQTIKAKIISDIRNDSTILYLKLAVDETDYEEHYKNDDCFLVTGTEKWRADLEYYNKEYFICIETNLAILNSSGFFDAVDGNTVVTIITHKYLGWIGWDFPVLSVQIGNEVYLDFETGKENWLKYMQAKIENPNAN